ncbi:hypothetical protein D3C75_576060 [compost metagenome]
MLLGVKSQGERCTEAFNCILYNYNPANNPSKNITVFRTPIFVIYYSLGTFSSFKCTEYN